MKNSLLLNRHTRAIIVGVLSSLLFTIWMSPSIGAQMMSKEDYQKGSNSRKSREQAIRSLPMDQLNRQTRRKISDVVEGASVYRRLPITTIESDPDLFVFLTRYPEVIVNIWQIMGVSNMTASRTGTYQLDTSDGVGTKATADLVFGSPGQHIYYCEGEYDGPLLLRPVRGRCVVFLQSDFKRGQDGKSYSTNRLDIFLKIDNLAASVIAKTVHPLVGSTADHNFVESMKFVENLSQTTHSNGAGVQRLSERLTKTSTSVRQRFSDIAGMVYERAQQGNRIGANTLDERLQTDYQQRIASTNARHGSTQQFRFQDTSQTSNSSENQPDKKRTGVRASLSSTSKENSRIPTTDLQPKTHSVLERNNR